MSAGVVVELPNSKAESWAAVSAALRKIAADPWESDVAADALGWLAQTLGGILNKDERFRSSGMSFAGLALCLAEKQPPSAGAALLRGVASLALAVADEFPSGRTAALPAGVSGVASLSRRQTASILACALFNLFEDTDSWRFSFEYHTGMPGPGPMLRGIVHYFDAVLSASAAPGTPIVWRRVALERLPDFERMTRVPLTEVVVAPLEARIEDAVGTLEADFANQHLGGGVLHGGNVQEEIRFGIVSPELFAGMLLCREPMREHEAIIAEGVVNYGRYTGYGRQLEFVGDALGSSEGAEHTIVAIDALMFPMDAQFKVAFVKREAVKAYAGFAWRTDPADRRPVATGKWGCGVFGGNNELKAAIQWLACSAAGRPMHFFPFGDQHAAQEVQGIVAACKEHQISTVAQLWSAIAKFCRVKLEHDTPETTFASAQQSSHQSSRSRKGKGSDDDGSLCVIN